MMRHIARTCGEALKITLLCGGLFLLAPAFGLLLSMAMIGMLAVLPLWGVYRAIIPEKPK